MPYSIDNPPEAVKGLPKKAQEIFIAAYNSAFEQYDGNEAKSTATAWAAVKMKYEKVDDEWKVKESSEMSAENKRNILQTALTDEYALHQDDPRPSGVYIEDVFEDYVIYNVNGQAYKSGYTLSEDGTATFNEPEKVIAKKTYEPMESLQTKYSDIIQEVGRRNASLDSSRIKKIVELCQELLSSEDPDEKKIKSVSKEADSTLKWLIEQRLVKTEDGVKYPVSAYALVADAEKPESWKLRMWEDLNKKITKTQLNKLAAALSPGGKEKVPAKELSAVKRKIRTAYRTLNVSEEDIPRWVKEVETRERLLTYTPLTEAKFDKGRATVIVIKPGFNASEDRYYPAEMLKRDFKVFEGQKMYADHPTEAEDKARPERSIKDWVATLSEVTCDENGVITGVAEIVEPWLMNKLASLRDKKMLSEMGISINAVGSASKGTIDGKETLVIEKLVAARSVDFVTEPGAGGIVTFYESDRTDIDLIEISALKDKRPDLIKIIEDDIRAKFNQEVKHKMDLEAKVKELESSVESLTTENTDLKTKISEAEKAQAKANAQATIKEAIEKAELPAAAKDMLLKRFETAESADGITEAIKAEADYIAKLSESGKVKDLGGTKPDPEKDRTSLKESFKRLHPEWSDSQIETAVAGR
jgi:cation transport regulator